MSTGTPIGERCPHFDIPGAFVESDGLCPGCLLQLVLDGDAPGNFQEEAIIGDTCGIYQLDGVLGRGGNGIVFLARRPGSRKSYALKMLASARFAGPEELRRFRLEAESAMALEHPNIIRVVDVGEENGAPFFVMEHAEGGSLADKLSREADPDSLRAALHERVGIVILVARAVHFAHERGVLHRDLKPANILMDGEGRPLVGDFGLARSLHSPSGVTMTGAALGTPAYMAPEQAAGATLTVAADVFSLGAVLFHLIAGRPPFEGNTPLETLRLVAGTDAPDPRTLEPWIDRDLAMICLTALRRQVAGRYASAAVLADDLERWSKGEAVLARPLSWPEKWVKWCRRHPIAATFSLSSAVAAFSLAIMFVTGSMMLREERNRALAQEAIARVSAANATLARDESRLNSYAADMYLAFRAFDDGHLGQARRMLARQEPPPGLPDLRGFEWHALSRRCRGDEFRVWQDHQGAVTAVAFSPDGKQVASAGRDGQLIVREVPEGGITLALPKGNAPRGVAEIPLMAAVASRSAELRKMMLGVPLNPDEVRMRGRPSKLGEISAVAWSPDGRRLATGGLGSYVRVWSYPAGEMLGVVPVITAEDLAFSPDGAHLAVFLHGEEDEASHELRIYQPDLSLAARVEGLRAAHAFSADGGTVAIIEAGGTRVSLLDTSTAEARSTFEPSVGLKQLAFSRDASVLWGVETGGTFLASWKTRGFQRLSNVFPVAGKFDLLCPLQDGGTLASTGCGQRLALQHAAGATPASLLAGHEDAIRSLTASPDGRWLVTGGNDHSTRLWSAAPKSPAAQAGAGGTGENDLSGPLKALLKPGAVIARAKNGFWVGDGSPEAEIRFLDLDGVERRKVRGPGGAYLRLVCTVDGGRLGAFAWPRGLHLLDDDGGSWREVWKLSSGTAGPIVFSTDGAWIASGGDDNMITVRRVSDGSEISLLKGHQGGIVDLAFTPDDRTLASTSEDGTLRLWHCPTWRDLGVLHQGERLGRLEFSADGSRLHARGDGGQIREFGREGN